MACCHNCVLRRADFDQTNLLQALCLLGSCIQTALVSYDRRMCDSNFAFSRGGRDAPPPFLLRDNGHSQDEGQSRRTQTLRTAFGRPGHCFGLGKCQWYRGCRPSDYFFQRKAELRRTGLSGASCFLLFEWRWREPTPDQTKERNIEVNNLLEVIGTLFFSQSYLDLPQIIRNRLSMTRSTRQQSMLFSSDNVSSFLQRDSTLKVVTSALAWEWGKTCIPQYM